MIAGLILSFMLASAATTKPAVKAALKPSTASKVLDFSADVIEGEMIRPRLFLELSSKADFVESSLYIRDDFNDFHAADARNRLHYIEPRVQQ